LHSLEKDIKISKNTKKIRISYSSLKREQRIDAKPKTYYITCYNCRQQSYYSNKYTNSAKAESNLYKKNIEKEKKQKN